MSATPPPSPYKGLRYYTADDASIFAARDADAKRCLRLLTGPASVVMLHGRTGCGKSSFLRAALKPLIERTDTGLWIAETSKTFIVVRSGLTPLRQVAGAIFDLAHDPSDSSHAPHVGDLREVLGGHQSKEDRTRFIDECSDSVEQMIEVLTALGEAAGGTPILVIDQAEEVFTLREKGERGISSGPRPPAEPPHALEDTGRARIDYMNLLRSIAAVPPGVKVLISLRTEYKGLFEDELRRDLDPDAGTRLTGFHLNDLDSAGLIAAIVSPTEVPATSGGGRFYRFEYGTGVANEIARRLLDPDAVPMGGVLPTLQVVCSRLYEQTRRSKTRAPGETWTIEITDLERLGKIDDQVAVHLRERLEEMFLKLRPGAGPEIAEDDRTTDIDQWYRLLERLVRLQGDGRAVTRQLPDSELRQLASQFRCRLVDRKALEYLAGDDIGILRCEPGEGVVPSAGKDEPATLLWTLGHDSLGLAIQKWAVTYKDSLAPTMRMDFNSPRKSAALAEKDLFPARDLLPESETPAPFHIMVASDLLWDHQIPFFAQNRRLSQRLGIHFFRDSDLVLSPPPKFSRVLVSADRAAFPPKADRGAWTDVAISNLFQGNGLVGPRIEGLQPLRAVEGDNASTVNELSRRLMRILEHLASVRATVLAYDESAESMMKLASYLAGTHPDFIGALRYERRTTTISAKEELFEQLARAGHEKSVFMVGTAYGRALASHRGYITYFDCNDLSRVMDILEKPPGDQPIGVLANLWSDPESRSRMFRLYQEIFSHTVWQVNIPPSEWRRIEHYPLVMRLAAVCYFAAEYNRSFPDDFVRHLYDWHANNFQETDRVSRETIREILQDCFQFLNFDEHPRLLFDPDNRFEFSPREPNGHEGGAKLPSTVAAIHTELTTLRKRTVDLFGEICWRLEQLERHRKDSRRDEWLRIAERLRGFAWANFRIFNYYDSARLMEQALRLVNKIVAETTSQVWQAEAAHGIRPQRGAESSPETRTPLNMGTRSPIQSD